MILRHTGPKSKIFDPIFTESFMVGNLGGLDATATTWFGDKQVYVHLINLLPITSITETLFDQQFVEVFNLTAIWNMLFEVNIIAV